MADDVQIAEAFAEYFRKTCTSFNEDQNTSLQSSYQNKRQQYVAGDTLVNTHKFHVELTEDVLTEIKRGKAAGLDQSIEHIIHSHPVLTVTLAKLFNCIRLCLLVTFHMGSGLVTHRPFQKLIHYVRKSGVNIYS